ncbi:MAG: hypothetical protein ABSF45_16255 [Terriglobia bacterium]|jgi:hypothetical protein
MNGTEQAFRLLVLRWPNPQPSLGGKKQRWLKNGAALSAGGGKTIGRTHGPLNLDRN